MATKKPRVAVCVDCGATVITRNGRTLRCKECSNRHTLEYKKRYRETHTATTTTGGSTEKPEGDILHFCDSPENIQKCLNCTLPKCKNCLSYTNQRWARLKAERMANNG